MPISDALIAPTRHMFAWLAADWPTHLCVDVSADRRQIVSDWVDRDLPLVVARNVAGDAADVARFGLALPDKTRIALCLHRRAIHAIQGPPLLDAARRAAPPAWQITIEAVLEAARCRDVGVRTYGSLAWQTLTSIEYLRPASDLDLLLVGANWSAVEQVARQLARLPETPRLDGEVLWPDGAGIAWREIAGGAPMLLVKAQNAVLMSPRAAFITRYGTRAA